MTITERAELAERAHTAYRLRIKMARARFNAGVGTKPEYHAHLAQIVADFEAALEKCRHPVK